MKLSLFALLIATIICNPVMGISFKPSLEGGKYGAGASCIVSSSISGLAYIMTKKRGTLYYKVLPSDHLIKIVTASCAGGICGSIAGGIISVIYKKDHEKTLFKARIAGIIIGIIGALP